ncbi:MAG: DUF58 domain-containing protein [Chloroflexi bacterium]|nr:DUF58 domain-containing protein [Chloroflexota bacterium]
MTDPARGFLAALVVVVGLALRNHLLVFLGILLGLVVATSWMWGKYCLRAVSYTRHLASLRLGFGEQTDLWIEVVNAKPLPLAWLRAEDELPVELALSGRDLVPGNRAARQVLDHSFTLRGYERVRRRYRLVARARGAFDVGPVALTSGDLFGFRTRSIEEQCVQTVLVYPRVVPMREIPLLAARPYGEKRARRWLLEDPLLLAGAREYRPGDSLRHIHWKASARYARLQMRTFDASADPHLVLMINGQTIEPAYAGTLRDKFEALLVVAASLARAALEAGSPVGVQTNAVMRDSHAQVRLPSSRHPAQLARILEAMALLTPYIATPFDQMLALERRRLPYGATVVILTTLFNPRIAVEMVNLKSAGHPVALVSLVEDRAVIETAAGTPAYFVDPAWQPLGKANSV